MVFFVQIAKSNESQSQLLVNMQTVTKLALDSQNNSNYNTFIEEVLYLDGKTASAETHKLQSWRTLEMQPKGFEAWNHTQNEKFLSFQTCSTLGTQSDDEECNKENLQMQSLSELDSTIRIQRRSPLKDITSKTLKSRSKKSKGTIQRQLYAYMSSLFPSGKKDPFPRQGKTLRV